MLLTINAEQTSHHAALPDVEVVRIEQEIPSTVVDILRPHQQDNGYICGGENLWC